MLRALYLALAASTLLMNSASASPEMVCHSAKEIARQLAEKYDETPVAAGVQANGNLLRVYATESRDTWTVVTTTPNGVSCVVAAGTHFEILRWQSAGEAL